MPSVQHQNEAHPGALLWIIAGLLSAVGVFMTILSFVPKY
jgi:hypothetical protein